MKKKKNIWIGIVSLILLATAIFAYNQSTKTHFNEENADGNTAGNLYNDGLFCQLEDTIYFSNLADDGALYSMDVNMSTYKKIYPDKVNYINASGRYIIYNRINNLREESSGSALEFINTGIYRIKRNGKAIIRLDKTPSGTVHQYGNDVYYLHYAPEKAYSLYQVGLDGNNAKEILKEAVSCAMVTDQYIYYTSVLNNHNINRLSRSTHQVELVKEGNYSQVILLGSSMYCIDNANNYSIVRMDIDGSNETTIVDNHVSTYNLSPDGNYLFYQADGGEDNGVYCVNLSTGESQLILAGNYENLCVTEDYLFFHEFDSSSMYYVRLNNPTEAQPFMPKIK